MGYLLMHIWLCLLAAALLGGLLMWLVSKLMTKNIREEIEGLWGGRLREAEARSSSLGADLIRVEGKIPGLEAQIGDWKTKFTGLETDQGQLSTKLSSLVSEHQTGLAAAAAAAGAAAASKLGTLEKDKHDLEARLAGSATQIQNLIADRNQVQAKLEALNLELATTKTQLASALHAEAQHSVQLQQVAQERDQLNSRFRGLSDEVALAKTQLAEYGAQTVVIAAERDQFKAQLAAASQASPLAMAAAAGAAAAMVVPSVPDEWHP